MPGVLKCLCVADSRAYSFDSYAPPPESRFTVDFIIVRGATVDQLLHHTLSKLRSYGEGDIIIIKLAAGINDLLEFERAPHAKRKVLKRSTVTGETLLSSFRSFKQRVCDCRRGVFLSVATIATASFSKFQASKRLDRPILGEDLLSLYQNDLDTTLDFVNAQVKILNSEQHFGIPSHTLSWHTSTRKSTKRRKRSGEYTVKVRNHFSLLYDGLHAVSGLKKRWHAELYKSLETDRQALCSHLGL